MFIHNTELGEGLVINKVKISELFSKMSIKNLKNDEHNISNIYIFPPLGGLKKVQCQLF